jgi:hypothetical protein
MKSVIIVIKLRRTNLDGAKDIYGIVIENPQGRYMPTVFTLLIAGLAYSSPLIIGYNAFLQNASGFYQITWHYIILQCLNF